MTSEQEKNYDEIMEELRSGKVSDSDLLHVNSMLLLGILQLLSSQVHEKDKDYEEEDWDDSDLSDGRIRIYPGWRPPKPGRSGDDGNHSDSDST